MDLNKLLPAGAMERIPSHIKKFLADLPPGSKREAIDAALTAAMISAVTAEVMVVVAELRERVAELENYLTMPKKE